MEYFKGTLKEGKVEDAKSNLAGCELNVYLIEKLGKMGLVNIKAESKYDEVSRVDVIGESKGNHMLMKVFPNNTKKIYFLPNGKNYFEAKFQLSGKTLKQVKKMKDAGLDNIHIYILKNVTTKKTWLIKEIYKLGGVILQSEINEEFIIQRIDDLKIKYDKIMQRNIYMVKNKNAN